MLAIAPVGWRVGWWHFRFAFTWLMTSSGVIAAAAAVVSLLALLLGWSELRAGGVAMAAIGLLLGAVLVYVPWQYNKTRSTVPRIHDITTDTANPPELAAVLPARAAEKAASAAYEGPELAKQQKTAYPDLAPLELTSAPLYDLSNGPAGVGTNSLLLRNERYGPWPSDRECCPRAEQRIQKAAAQLADLDVTEGEVRSLVEAKDLPPACMVWSVLFLSMGSGLL